MPPQNATIRLTRKVPLYITDESQTGTGGEIPKQFNVFFGNSYFDHTFCMILEPYEKTKFLRFES